MDDLLLIGQGGGYGEAELGRGKQEEGKQELVFEVILIGYLIQRKQERSVCLLY